MKRLIRQRFGKVATIAVVALTLTIAWALMTWPTLPRAYAAKPYTGSQSAMAGTGGTTSGLFVKIETAHATTPKIITATASTDAVIGVCELTASANALTKYAPIGTQASVTAGETVAAGALVTAGTGGKAFNLGSVSSSAQRIAGLALSGGDANETITIAVLAGYQPTSTFTSALISTNGKLAFRDANTYIHSNAQDNMTAGGTWADLGVVTTADINGGTIDAATVGAATPAAGKFTTLQSTGVTTLGGNITITTPTVTGTWTDLGVVTTADINGGTIDAAAIGGATAAAGKFTTLESTGATTMGAGLTITNCTVTGTWTDLGIVTTADINGGTIDAATVGAATPAAGKFTTLEATGVTTLGGNITITTPTVTGTWTDLGVVTTADINGGSIDGATIGAATAGAITGTTITASHATTPAIATASGKTNTGTITVAGKTNGSFVLTTADSTGQAVTLAPAAQTSGAGSVTIPDLAAAAKYMTTAADAAGKVNTTEIDEATVSSAVASGVPVRIVFTVTAAGTYTFTVPAGRKLRVLDAYTWKIGGAGAHGDDELTIQNNDGSPANIFTKLELNAISDGTRTAFDGYDDGEADVAAASTLDLIMNEDANTGGDSMVVIDGLWITPQGP